MTDAHRELIVFPTELSLRNFQRHLALEQGVVDASSHTTFSRILQVCAHYSDEERPPLHGTAEYLQLRRVVAVARTQLHPDGPLSALSDAALGAVLRQWIVELASLPDEVEQIVGWLMHRTPRDKQYQLGQLYRIWRSELAEVGKADQIDCNTAVLRLLRGHRSDWPPLLRQASAISLQAVRWLNPFEEMVLAALADQIPLRLFSALPPAHAELAADRLGQRIRSEIMDRPWAGWTEGLGDTLAVESEALMDFADQQRIGFARAAGNYGEIEDLARRIDWYLRQGMEANRILLVVPELGSVQDIIPHVFSRFGIPYYFRRGRAVLSAPSVKAFFSLLALPLRAERDRLIDLLRNPALRWPEVTDVERDVAELQRRMLPKLTEDALPDFLSVQNCSGKRALALLRERVVEPEDALNISALEVLERVLDELGSILIPLDELIDLLEQRLADETVSPVESDEQGVWVLNPYDAVGLEFDVVLFASLNEGVFPAEPQQDVLLNDAERYALRCFLEEQGSSLPFLALATAGCQYEQQSVRFLSALGLAREQVVFSYQAVDEKGAEKLPGDYFQKLWRLVGWGAQEELVVHPYDVWRIQTLEEARYTNVFQIHIDKQAHVAPADRVPFPGESYLSEVPLPLCRARDEALQSTVHGQRYGGSSKVEPDDTLRHLAKMLKMEAQRAAWIDTVGPLRSPQPFCGQLPRLKAHIQTSLEHRIFSASALESLAHCRYVFLLEQLFGLREARSVDDAADPVSRGNLIHRIMDVIYTSLAGLKPVAPQWDALCTPRRWAVKGADGWRLREVGGVDALPLVSFDPEHMSALMDFAEEVTRSEIKRATDEEKLTGHPGVWAAEAEKIRVIVQNYLQYDLQTAIGERRFPALFEMVFGSFGDEEVDEDTLVLESDGQRIRLRGRIDRVDLLFDRDGLLKKIRVLDYKGSSRLRRNAEEYIEAVRRNLDCQLPIYAFAVQQRFFGTFNLPELNALTEVGYHVYQRDPAAAGKGLKKSLVAMNALMEDGQPLSEAFLAELFSNWRQIKEGNFAVDPLIQRYSDYQSICRVVAIKEDE